ncbi:MAG: co-chaperone GroES [Patescibacteria group bacterium]
MSNTNSNDFKLKPIGKRIVVRPADKENKTSFGLVIPDTASQDAPNKGVVVAVGPMVGFNNNSECCRNCDDSNYLKSDLIKEGSTVLFSKYSPTEVEFEGEKYLIISENDVMCVIE